jgi:hypothetical protein
VSTARADAAIANDRATKADVDTILLNFCMVLLIYAGYIAYDGGDWDFLQLCV